jgi:NhaA family Na+:H+ antiporter
MERHPPHAATHVFSSARSIVDALERFLHIEAASGLVLIVAAVVALVWANSPFAHSYHELWHAPVALQIGSLSISHTLHFVVNDVLMTIFFLVVGLEIRREMHDGSLAGWRVAALPVVAALGGVMVPAVIYLTLVHDPHLQAGWAVPTATDIAFAVGALALLGKSIPIGVRIFLLAFAVIDDIVAILIIALFYSSGLEWSGFPFLAGGLLLVLAMQRLGVNSAFAYTIPGAVIWYGLMRAGLHPTLAGVILGLMTPVRTMRGGDASLETIATALGELRDRVRAHGDKADEVLKSVKMLTAAPLDLVAPVIRVQSALHPWVAYVVMPLFALANAGVSLDGLNFDHSEVTTIMMAIILALVLGKPIGIMASTWASVRTGMCQLPTGLNWFGVLLAGCLGGIGFTMSIFIANLAFPAAETLAAAKLGVLLASVTAGVIGIVVGRFYLRRHAVPPAES